MFTSVEGLAPVLVEYFVALNNRDVERALACIHPDVTFEVENGPTCISSTTGRDGFHAMLIAMVNVRLLAVSPVSADLDEEVISVQAAVFVIRTSGEGLRLMQRVDFGVTDELIVSMRVKLPRGLREFPGVHTR